MSTAAEILALAERLTRVADLGDRARLAATTGRHFEAGPLFRELGQALHPLKLALSGGLSLADNPAGREMMGILQAGVAKLSQAELAREEWLRVPEAAAPAARVLMADPEWNSATDLLILLGADLLPLARESRALGQTRVMLWHPNPPAASLPEGVGSLSGPEALRQQLESLGLPLPAKVRVVLGAPPEATAQIRGSFVDALERSLRDLRVRQNTLDQRGEVWVLQAIGNLPVVAGAPSIDTVRGALSGTPAVICAAGPSLDEGLAALREYRDRVVVIAVSRAVQSLVKAGVVPDLVVCAEAADVSYHLRDAPLDQVGALVLCATAHPALFSLPARQFLAFSANGWAEDWVFDALGEQASLPGGGSVAHNATRLALELGCGPLIFAGLDLAFRGSQMYAAGTSDGSSRLQVDPQTKTYRLEGRSAELLLIQKEPTAEPVMEVRGVSGQPVLTSLSMDIFRGWFERLAKELPPGTLVNSSQGALIEDVVHRPLKETLAELPVLATPPRAVLDERLAQVALDLRLERMGAWITEQVSTLKDVAELSRKARYWVKRVADNAGHLPQLEAAEKPLRQRLSQSRFLGLLRQRELREAMVAGRQAKDLRSSLRASEALFEVAKDAAQKVLPPLELAATGLARALADRRQASARDRIPR